MNVWKLRLWARLSDYLSILYIIQSFSTKTGNASLDLLSLTPAYDWLLMQSLSILLQHCYPASNLVYRCLFVSSSFVVDVWPLISWSSRMSVFWSYDLLEFAICTSTSTTQFLFPIQLARSNPVPACSLSDPMPKNLNRYFNCCHSLFSNINIFRYT